MVAAPFFRWVGTFVSGFVHYVMWNDVFDIMFICVGASVIYFVYCVVLGEVIMNLDICLSSLGFAASFS